MNDERARRMNDYIGDVIEQLNHMPNIVEIVERSGRVDLIALCLIGMVDEAERCYDNNMTRDEAVSHIANLILVTASEAQELVEQARDRFYAKMLETLPVHGTH